MEYVIDMGLYRSLGDVHFGGNFFIGVSFRDQGQDFQLSGRKAGLNDTGSRVGRGRCMASRRIRLFERPLQFRPHP